MTNYSNPAGSPPADTKEANWNWLQRRLETKNADLLSEWLTEQLDAIEVEFAYLITDKSRHRGLRDDRS